MSSIMREDKKAPGYIKFVLSGLAGMTAICFVQPMDLVKTRMQMTGIGGAKREYANAIDCAVKVIRNEGMLKLWTGLGAGLLRQATYTTSRMGVYQKLVEYYRENVQETPTLAASMAMGGLSGAAGAVVGNPADVALIRMVTDGKLPPDQRRNYKNIGNALVRIVQEDGVKGLWRGVIPTMGRTVMVNMTALATYSQLRAYLTKGPFQMKDGLLLQATASTFSGFLTAITSLPLDIVKTRIQNMKTQPGKELEYTGTVDALTKVVKYEGVFALWKGFTPYFARLVPLTALTFILIEQYNHLYCKHILGTNSKSGF